MAIARRTNWISRRFNMVIWILWFVFFFVGTYFNQSRFELVGAFWFSIIMACFSIPGIWLAYRNKFTTLAKEVNRLKLATAIIVAILIINSARNYILEFVKSYCDITVLDWLVQFDIVYLFNLALVSVVTCFLISLVRISYYRYREMSNFNRYINNSKLR